MAQWNSGYVVDVGYVYGFYPELSPAHLGFLQTLLNKSVTAAQAATYCELGCGQGLSTNLLATANPTIHFYATDFNPSHIMGAQQLAHEAGLKNVTFFDHSFSEFLQSPDLPQFDIIALHGIYSWVAAEHRANIVEFLRLKLKPGGLVYISYNALPGWAAAAPMRHLMFQHSQAVSTPDQVGSALQFVEQLFQVNAKYFHASPLLKPKLDQLKQQKQSYLAHEYLNEEWSLFYHSDVVVDLAEAKLGFLGSADVLDHVDAVNLTSDQQQLLKALPDRAFRETVRDYIVSRQFRRDVFGRGSLSLSPVEAQQQWLEQRFVLMRVRKDIPAVVKSVLGEATLQPAIYGPILDALAAGARTVHQLVAEPQVAAIGWAALVEAMTVLVGASYVSPCLESSGDAKRAAKTKVFNAVVIRRARYSDEILYLASPVTGSGFRLGRVELLFLLCHQQKITEAKQYVWDVLKSQNQRVNKDGKALLTEEENLGELAERHADFMATRLPVLQQLGIA